MTTEDRRAAGERAPAHEVTAFVRDRTTLVLYAALGAFGASQTVPSLAAPSLRDELGYGYGLASAHLSAYAVGAVLAGLVGARATRQVGRRGVLLLGLGGAATGSAALTLGRAPWATLLACLVAGGVGTLVLVAVQAGLADHHGDRRAVAFAESNVVASVGTTLAPLLVGGLTAATGSWRWGIVALAVAALAAAAYARRTPITTLPAEVVEDRAQRLPSRARAGVLLVFCSVLLEFSVSFWGATYLRDVVGLSGPAAVTAMVCFFGAMLTGRVTGAVLARTRPAAQLIAAAMATAAAGLVLAALSTSAPASLVALVLLGLGISVLFPLGLSLAIAAAPRASESVSSHCVTAGGLAVLVGPLLIGALADAGSLRGALVVLPVVLAAGAAALNRTV